MLSDRELMRLQIEALYTHNDAGRMLRVNEANGVRAPRFFLGCTPVGNEWRFRDDISDEIANELDALCRRATLRSDRAPSAEDVEPFQRVLERVGSKKIVSSGPAYRFPMTSSAKFASEGAEVVMITERNRELLRENFSSWYDDVPNCQPFAAAIIRGQAVSICASVRISAAYEAGLETHLSFRGCGYAKPVVMQWGSAVQGIGRIPIYSTSWDNHASMAVARKLELVQFGSDLNID